MDSYTIPNRGEFMSIIFKKAFTVITVCCLFISCFASCKSGIDEKEAKEFVNDFFQAIVAEDYENAATFLHPERPADLEPFLLDVEREESIDFQRGIKIEKYTSVSAASYDSTVNGSTCELTMETTVGEKNVKFTIEIVQNENGYGIYNLDIDT